MIENEIYATIDCAATGQRIKKLLIERNISVGELAQFMGFEGSRAIYKWQAGKALPSVDNLYALSRVLHTTIEDILVGNDEMSSRHFCGKIELQVQ